MERTVQTQIIGFMDQSRQWNKNLHAYRALHSTTTASLQITDFLVESADRGMVPNAMFIDQSAAFDCVEAEILNKKLELYKFSSNNARMDLELPRTEIAICEHWFGKL